MDRKEDVEEQVDRLRETAHRVWLAGLGALAATEEEGSRIFQRLVDRGREAFEPSPMEDLDAMVTSALHRLGVPTRTEIAELTRRIEELDASLAKFERGAPASVESRGVTTLGSYALPGDSGTDPR